MTEKTGEVGVLVRISLSKEEYRIFRIIAKKSKASMSALGRQLIVSGLQKYAEFLSLGGESK